VPGFYGRPMRYSVPLVDIGARETGIIPSRWIGGRPPPPKPASPQARQR
jgi:hypothetical protein